jgi:hypothetical protein
MLKRGWLDSNRTPPPPPLGLVAQLQRAVVAALAGSVPACCSRRCYTPAQRKWTSLGTTRSIGAAPVNVLKIPSPMRDHHQDMSPVRSPVLRQRNLAACRPRYDRSARHVPFDFTSVREARRKRLVGLGKSLCAQALRRSLALSMETTWTFQRVVYPTFFLHCYV